MSKDTIVVNIFSEPGFRNSVFAAYIYSQLSLKGVSSEYISGFAKDEKWRTYEERLKVFSRDIVVNFDEQYKKLKEVNGKVDVIVTDSPLLLCALHDSKFTDFNDTVVKAFNEFNNYNIVLYHPHPEGRFTVNSPHFPYDRYTEEEIQYFEFEHNCFEIGNMIHKLLDRHNIKQRWCPFSITEFLYNQVIEIYQMTTAYKRELWAKEQDELRNSKK